MKTTKEREYPLITKSKSEQKQTSNRKWMDSIQRTRNLSVITNSSSIFSQRSSVVVEIVFKFHVFISLPIES